jgi:DNA-binding MarR family transcriptional regulator/ribosomal protein S18 acetylase RimI-like enzyme
LTEAKVDLDDEGVPSSTVEPARTGSPGPAQVAAVRAFTRAWTVVNDVLGDTYLGTPFTLTEARILFELAQRPATALVELRRRLRLDAGYTTRIMTGLTDAGLVRRETDPRDGRRQIIALTAAGRDAVAGLDARSAERVATLLDALPDDGRRRLTGALDTVRRVLEGVGAGAGDVLIRPAGPGDLGWVLDRHAVLYRREFGWGARFEASVAHIVAEAADRVDDPGQRGWIAENPAGRLGSVLCMRQDATTARLRLLLVEPAARGLRVGRRLVDTCLDFAATTGYESIMLTTQDACTAARRIYAAAGFELESTSREESYDPAGVSELWRRGLENRGR